MRARRNELHHVFRADDRQQERLEVAIDRGDEHRAARPHELRQRGDRAVRIGHVLEHLHACDDIKLAGVRCEQRFRVRHSIFDGQVGFRGMQARDLDHAFGKIDAGHLRAGLEQRFAEEPAAAAHVQHARIQQLRAIGNELRPHRIQDVQRFELALRVPEAVRERVEFAHFRRVGRGVRGGGGGHRFTPDETRSAHCRARRASSRSSKASSWDSRDGGAAAGPHVRDFAPRGAEQHRVRDG